MEKGTNSTRDAQPPAAERLDSVDESIIAQLQEDGRRSYSAIGRALGLSEGTVRWRVRRLLDTGRVKIVTFADPFGLGYHVLASIFIRVRPEATQGVVDALVSWPDVMYVSSCAGRVDIYIQVVCRDHEALWQMLTERIPALGGVIETETLMELKVHKFSTYPHMFQSPAEAP